MEKALNELAKSFREMDFLEKPVTDPFAPLHWLTKESSHSDSSILEEVDLINNSLMNLFKLTPNVDASTRKCYIKKLRQWRLCHISSFQAAVETHLVKMMKTADVLQSGDITFLSFIIEEFISLQNTIAPHLELIICKISLTFSRFVNENMQNPQLLFKTIKLVLQMFQVFKKTLKIAISKTKTDVEFLKSLSVIGDSCLYFIVYSEKHQPNICQLCGVVIGFMLSYNDDKVSCEIANKILHGKSVEIEIMQKVFLTQSNHLSIFETPSIIWIIRGILCCCPQAIFFPLCMKVPDNPLQPFPQLNNVFNKIINVCQICDDNLQYHGFYTLHLWWSNLQGVVARYNISNDLIIEYQHTTLTMIYDNWDTPVAGGVALLMNTLSCLLDIDKLSGGNSDFVASLRERLLSTSVYVKGKYGPLVLLVKKFGAGMILQQNPDFLDQLVFGLGSNHLASIVSKLYKAVLLDLFSTKQDHFDCEKWEKLFAKSLINALVNKSPLIRHNALHYLVPVNVRLHNDVFPRLQHQLMQFLKQATDELIKETCLSALIGVLKAVRHGGVVEFQHLNTDLIQCGLAAFDNETRANAFLLVCKSFRKSDIVSAEEFQLLYENISLNLNSDSAVFRHEFLFAVRVLLSRIQCSVITAEKQKVFGYVSECMKFIKKLQHLCMNSLYPCSSFQRKITCLSIFEALLCTFIAQRSGTSKRKGVITNEDFEVLLNAVARHDIILTSEDHVSRMLWMFEDVVPDVRETSYDVLTQYFSFDLLCYFKDEVQQKYKALLNSPKAQDTESGCIYLQLMLNQFVFQHNPTATSSNLSVNASHNLCVTNFLSILREELSTAINRHISEYKRDELKAAYCFPAFGWILALSKCLNKFISHENLPGYFNESLRVNFWEFIHRIVQDIRDFVHFLLQKVFSCAYRDDTGKTVFTASADFQEMSLRIDGIVNLSEIDKTREGNDINRCEDNEVLLTKNHEVVLSSCWLSLKNSCALLSSLGNFLIKVDFMSGNQQKLKYSDCLTEICCTMTTVLSMCRHRGVIESCYLSFVETCVALFSSKEYASIPEALLDSVLECQGRKPVPMKPIPGGTITRRSAGLPLITDALLSAVVKSEKSRRNLLDKTMSTLLASLDYLKVNDKSFSVSHVDLPQVDALYILKDILQNTVLTVHVTPYLTPVFISCISCLNSSLWVVRNASAQLIGVVSSKMLGQQHVEDQTTSSSTNSITASEFFSRFPDLLEFFRNVFQNGISLNQTSKLSNHHFIKPEIFPIISILSKLACIHDDNTTDRIDLSFMLPALLELRNCSLYSVRNTAVELTLSICPPKTVASMIVAYLQSLPTNHGDLNGILLQNEFNGWLILILFFFRRNKSRDSTKEEISSLIIARCWLATPAGNSCPLTAALYLDIINEILTQSVVEASKLEGFDFDEASIYLDKRKSWANAVGYCLYLEKFIRLLLDLSADDDLSIRLAKCIELNREHVDWFACKACIEWMIGKVPVFTQSQLFVATEFLFLIWSEVGPRDNQIDNASLILFVKLRHFFFNAKQLKSARREKFVSFIFSRFNGDACLSLRCSLMKAEAVAVAWTLISDNSFQQIQTYLKRWVIGISENTSHTRSSEPLRQSSAESLEIAGMKVMQWIAEQINTSNSKDTTDVLMEEASKLFTSSVWLLLDEQPDIREPACSFVSSLDGDREYVIRLHHNYAIQKLLTFMTSRLPPHVSTMNAMMRFYCDVTTPSFALNSHASLFQQEAFNMYLEEEQLLTILMPFLQKVFRDICDIPDKWIADHLSNCIGFLDELDEQALILGRKDVFKFVLRIMLYVEVVLIAIKQWPCVTSCSKLLITLNHCLVKCEVFAPIAIKHSIQTAKCKVNELTRNRKNPEANHLQK